MKDKTAIGTAIGIVVFYFLIIAFVITCWIVNVVKFAKCDFQEPYKAEIVHGVGLIPGISIVTAWFPGDTPSKEKK